MLSLEKQLEIIASALTAGSLYLVSMGDMTGWILAVFGSLVWVILSIRLNLYFMAALNFTLGFIAINALQLAGAVA